MPAIKKVQLSTAERIFTNGIYSVALRKLFGESDLLILSGFKDRHRTQRGRALIPFEIYLAWTYKVPRGSFKQ